MNKTCLIIGGGMGGLFTGAFLAKNSVKVTVLEKNEIIGGGLQCFQRKGKIFETGMHVLGGFHPGGNLRKICSYLGILDKLKIQHIPDDCMDEIYYHKTGEVFHIASGRKGFVDSLAAYFPKERSNLKRYIDELYRITNEVSRFSLREETSFLQVHSENFRMAADKLIASYIDDPKLRDVLAYLNPFYSGIKGLTPAYVHALLSVLYINGASRFESGSQQLAQALQDVIELNGGQVILGCNVTQVDVKDRCVTHVLTADGNKYTAAFFVSSLHPTVLAGIISPGTFRPGFVNRLNSLPDTASAFSVYIDLKEKAFPYIDHTCYYNEDFGQIWQQENEPIETWPRAFMYMTPPDADQTQYASRLLVHCLMDFKEVERWENTITGHRGEDYEVWKKQRVEAILAKLSLVHPEINEAVANIYSASPLTIRDFFGTRRGSIFGYRKDCDNMFEAILPVYTKVKNLYLTGQNLILHGNCGVPLTALSTAEAVLGRNLINEINDHDETDC